MPMLEYSIASPKPCRAWDIEGRDGSLSESTNTVPFGLCSIPSPCRLRQLLNLIRIVRPICSYLDDCFKEDATSQ